MDTILLLILQVIIWEIIPALFTVEVERPSHVAKFAGDVTMACKFQPGPGDLSVTWRRVLPPPAVEVYRLEKGQEDSSSQSPLFRGRARMLTEELVKGRALLEISQLRITDSGMYQCVLKRGGIDYKQTNLSVRASYGSPVKSIKTLGNDELELICESRGYPLATVVWTKGKFGNVIREPMGIHSITPDQLFQVISSIAVKASEHNNYTCAFVQDDQIDQQASFHIPAEIPIEYSNGKGYGIAIIVLLAVTAVTTIAVVFYRRRGIKRCAWQHSSTTCTDEGDLTAAQR